MGEAAWARSIADCEVRFRVSVLQGLSADAAAWLRRREGPVRFRTISDGYAEGVGIGEKKICFWQKRTCV